jgi:hypothetical protein
MKNFNGIYGGELVGYGTEVRGRCFPVCFFVLYNFVSYAIIFIWYCYKNKWNENDVTEEWSNSPAFWTTSLNGQ